MPPFSPGVVPCAGAKVVLPNSMNEFCPEKPWQPSLRTQGGSIRPVDRLAVQLVAPVVGEVVQALGGSLALVEPPPVTVGLIDLPAQSAPAQYTAPGMRRSVGRETCSAVFAMFWPIAELPHGAVPPPVHAGLPSAGPPAS